VTNSNDPFVANDPMARTVIVPQPKNVPRASNAPAGAAKSQSYDATVKAKSGESFDLDAYPNPLLRAAGPVLVSATQLRDTLTNADPAATRKRIAQEIRGFESNAKGFGVSAPQVSAARYILCTFLDEVALGTPWGAESGWSRKSLLSEFHGETFGGEKVFSVIKKAQSEPGNYARLLELAYIVLLLGFEGQYRVRDGGQLKAVQENLYQILHMQRTHTEKALSPNWRGKEEARSDKFMKIVPIWMIAAAGFLILSFIYISFTIALNEVREPVYRLTQKIGTDGGDLLASAPAPLVEPFDLEGRLVPYVGNGLEVSIDNGVATVLIRGAFDNKPLFQSGNAQIFRGALPMLEKIAEVLEAVPGDVTIMGHTDSVGRIQSNQRLSVRRAEAVRGELVAMNIERLRMEVRGMGASVPAAPNDTEGNRAKNRRVEIRFRVPDGMLETIR